LLKVPYVDELRARLPYETFLEWWAYFEQRPPDWRDDDRFSKILQALGAKGSPDKYFATLKPIYNPEKSDKNLKNSTFWKFAKAAIGGDNLAEMQSENDQD
jgi:hypothetical protein